MSLFSTEQAPSQPERAPIPTSELDLALTAQIVVGWAGEGGEDTRLGWWRSDLVSEYGGEDLFRRLLPTTWRWAVLQGAREAARRKDAELRAQDGDPDRILSLFNLGFAVDEKIEERLQSLKRSGLAPKKALAGLEVVTEAWDPRAFGDWVRGHGEADATVTSVGRRLKGARPGGLDRLVRRLVAGLAPLADSYPLPHFRREK